MPGPPAQRDAGAMFTTVPDAALAVAADRRRELLDDAARHRLARLARRAARRRAARAAAAAARDGRHLPRPA